jgi:predicted RNA-binding protein with RPS1 domain
MVLEIDEDKRRISLGMKQCKANPWQEFAQNTKRGDRVKGPIKSITDFGVFVGLAAGIDGLVHLSDLSWNEPGDVAVRNYKKGQEVEALVLAVDVDRERISLGIKQLDSDPFTTFVSVNDKGQVVTGKVKTGRPEGRRDRSGPGRRRATCAPPRSAATASKTPATCSRKATKSLPWWSTWIARPATSSCRSRPRMPPTSRKPWPR